MQGKELWAHKVEKQNFGSQDKSYLKIRKRKGINLMEFELRLENMNPNLIFLGLVKRNFFHTNSEER